MAPSIAADRAGKARLFEHKDVRVRAGARSARSTGKLRQQDVAETGMPARNGFGYFPRKESNPLAAASGTKASLRESKAGFRVLAFGQPRNDEQIKRLVEPLKRVIEPGSIWRQTSAK